MKYLNFVGLYLANIWDFRKSNWYDLFCMHQLGPIGI